MTNGILLNGSADIDFMIHGVFPYQFFGQTVWITTTHICLLIVLLLILAFAIAANRAMKHASEVPGFFQNIVELGFLDEGVRPNFYDSPKEDALILWKKQETQG